MRSTFPPLHGLHPHDACGPLADFGEVLSGERGDIALGREPGFAGFLGLAGAAREERECDREDRRRAEALPRMVTLPVDGARPGPPGGLDAERLVVQPPHVQVVDRFVELGVLVRAEVRPNPSRRSGWSPTIRSAPHFS